MRKILAIVLGVVLALGVAAPVMAEGSIALAGGVQGDVNGDGNVNALDLTKVERIIAGLDEVTAGADVTGDGAINAMDITGIERIIAGLEAVGDDWQPDTGVVYRGSPAPEPVKISWINYPLLITSCGLQ